MAENLGPVVCQKYNSWRISVSLAEMAAAA
jgi:hypothetical protein